MEGVRLGKEELIRAYGVSQRLAVRVGALLSKGFEVSGTLLEIAGPGSAIEKLLLHPEMLALADLPAGRLAGLPAAWRGGRRWR